MLKVQRTVYFQICRQIKAKTPFAPVFYDIRKSQLFYGKTFTTFQEVLKFTIWIEINRDGVTQNFRIISRLADLQRNITTCFSVLVKLIFANIKEKCGKVSTPWNKLDIERQNTRGSKSVEKSLSKSIYWLESLKKSMIPILTK